MKYYVNKSTPANRGGYAVMSFETKAQAIDYLRGVVKAWRDEAPKGKKRDAAFMTSQKTAWPEVVAYDGGDRVEYRIMKEA